MSTHWVIEEPNKDGSRDVIRQDAWGKLLVVRVFLPDPTDHNDDDVVHMANEVVLMLADQFGGTAHPLPL